MRLTSLGYDEWIRHIFDHPAEGPQWYLDPDAPYWDGPAVLTLAHTTRLFQLSARSVAGYNDAQVNQGLWYLLSDVCTDVLGNPFPASTARCQCIHAMASIFRDLFVPRCTPHLSHRSETEAGPLNSVCYMWWDILPLVPQPESRERRDVDAAALEVMEQALGLDSIACQESALHGLGHWKQAYPAGVTAIIDRYLEHRPDARPELLAYARSARSGCVL
jgi:hypothetical protein